MSAPSRLSYSLLVALRTHAAIVYSFRYTLDFGHAFRQPGRQVVAQMVRLLAGTQCQTLSARK